MMRLRHCLQLFCSDEQGVALVLVAIMLPVIIGFAVLAIDMSRVNNLHNDLQQGADAFALAGAAELDGNSDAIIRANNAINNLIANQTDFSTLNHYTLKSTDVTVTFLKDLPASDSTALDKNGNEINAAATPHGTTDPSLAQFVEITVNPTDFSTIFPASFIGGANSFQVSTQAVAGNAGQVTCAMTPVFICDPFKNVDGSGPGFNEAVASGQWIGRSVTLETKGTAWGPGNFGFLRPSSDPGYGDTDLSKDLARGTVQECVNSRHLYTSTGNLTANDIEGLNTRFDMFPANGNSFPSKSDPSWPAAKNVRKGYMPGSTGQPSACNIQPGNDITKYMGLPADTGADSTIQSGLVGNGTWNYSQYIATNNLSAVKAYFDGLGISQPTRQAVYAYEFQNQSIIDTASVGGETGAPLCTSNVSNDPDRRLIYGAIVDCSDPDNIASLNGASGTNLKAEGFGSFLMLSPVVTSIQTEAVDVSGRAGQGTMANFVRNEVQLYR